MGGQHMEAVTGKAECRGRESIEPRVVGRHTTTLRRNVDGLNALLLHQLGDTTRSFA